MMEEMNKWLSAHKQLCVITGIFGLLVSPFLWPVFLAVIIQSLSLVIPVAAGLFFYEKFIMKKDKEETNENDDDNKVFQIGFRTPPSYMQMLKRPRIYRKMMRRDRKR